jgi:ABC-type antimicrobial peptide transport system permease subunit
VVLGIGLISGIYPAWRAARVRPLESIRSEGD